jgi:hypothetical protein
MDRRATAFAVLGVAARAGHQLGDYVAQTNSQATHKAAPGYNPGDPDALTRTETWRHNLGHVAGYHATLAAVVGATLAATGVRVRPSRAAAALAVSAGSHALIDRRWPVRLLMRCTGSAAYYPAGAPHVDQALHDGCLWVAVLIAASGARTHT